VGNFSLPYAAQIIRKADRLMLWKTCRSRMVL